MADYDNDCGTTNIQAYYRSACSDTACITLDLSVFSGLSKTLFTADETKTFTATASASCCSSGTIEYQVTFTSTPSGFRSDLIHIDTDTSPIVKFESTSNAVDA